MLSGTTPKKKKKIRLVSRDSNKHFNKGTVRIKRKAIDPLGHFKHMAIGQIKEYIYGNPKLLTGSMPDEKSPYN